MGTRSDFYVGRGPEAEWLGSISWDGYPAGVDDAVFFPTTEHEYRVAVTNFLASRDDRTLPIEPWPWPWDDSGTTDYAYAYENGKVYASNFGRTWFEVNPNEENGGEPEDSEDDVAVFPDMSARRGSWGNVMSKSGLLVASVTPDGGMVVETGKEVGDRLAHTSED
jgi:hypothetical protein